MGTFGFTQNLAVIFFFFADGVIPVLLLYAGCSDKDSESMLKLGAESLK